MFVLTCDCSKKDSKHQGTNLAVSDVTFKRQVCTVDICSRAAEDAWKLLSLHKYQTWLRQWVKELWWNNMWRAGNLRYTLPWLSPLEAQLLLELLAHPEFLACLLPHSVCWFPWRKKPFKIQVSVLNSVLPATVRLWTRLSFCMSFYCHSKGGLRGWRCKFTDLSGDNIKQQKALPPSAAVLPGKQTVPAVSLFLFT